ncbi:MAG: FHA domain-containing protein [Ktedonobacterales bacterium]
MVVCTHCGRESRAADRFCQYCGQQLDPGNGHLVAAYAPHYAGANSEPVGWRGPLAEAASAASSVQDSSQDLSRTSPQPPTHARLIVRQLPDASGGDLAATSESEGAVREYQIDGGDVAIGRAPSCDIVLEGDQLASRRHALLRRKDNAYTVVDLGSSNGTYVNDLEIREATVLKEGDVITIGAHEIVFSMAPASPHASVPGAALAGAPAAPLGETDPSASAVNAPPFSAPAESAAVAPEAIGEDAVLSPDSEAADQQEGDVADASAASAASATDAGAAPAAVESNAQDTPVESVGSEDTGSSEAEPASAADVVALATASAPTATATSDLEGLRAQLAEISAALARKADEEARAADRLRATLAEARDRLAALSEQRAQQLEQSAAEDAPVPAQNVGELVSVARQAAENPRHLDYLTSFAAHASEIAAALEALEAHQASASSSTDNAELLDVLDELRTRLDDALNQR